MFYSVVDGGGADVRGMPSESDGGSRTSRSSGIQQQILSPGGASTRSVQFSNTVIAITPDGEKRQEVLLQRASRELLYFSPPPQSSRSSPTVPLSPECDDIEQSCLQFLINEGQRLQDETSHARQSQRRQIVRRRYEGPPLARGAAKKVVVVEASKNTPMKAKFIRIGPPLVTPLSASTVPPPPRLLAKTLENDPDDPTYARIHGEDDSSPPVVALRRRNPPSPPDSERSSVYEPLYSKVNKTVSRAADDPISTVESQQNLQKPSSVQGETFGREHVHSGKDPPDPGGAQGNSGTRPSSTVQAGTNASVQVQEESSISDVEDAQEPELEHSHQSSDSNEDGVDTALRSNTALIQLTLLEERLSSLGSPSKVAGEELPFILPTQTTTERLSLSSMAPPSSSDIVKDSFCMTKQQLLPKVTDFADATAPGHSVNLQNLMSVQIETEGVLSKCSTPDHALHRIASPLLDMSASPVSSVQRSPSVPLRTTEYFTQAISPRSSSPASSIYLTPWSELEHNESRYSTLSSEALYRVRGELERLSVREIEKRKRRMGLTNLRRLNSTYYDASYESGLGGVSRIETPTGHFVDLSELDEAAAETPRVELSPLTQQLLRHEAVYKPEAEAAMEVNQARHCVSSSVSNEHHPLVRQLRGTTTPKAMRVHESIGIVDFPITAVTSATSVTSWEAPTVSGNANGDSNAPVSSSAADASGVFSSSLNAATSSPKMFSSATPVMMSASLKEVVTLLRGIGSHSPHASVASTLLSPSTSAQLPEELGLWQCPAQSPIFPSVSSRRRGDLYYSSTPLVRRTRLPVRNTTTVSYGTSSWQRKFISFKLGLARILEQMEKVIK